MKKRMTHLCIVLMLALYLPINAQKMTFNNGKVTLKEAFEKIETLSMYKIAYNESQLDVSKLVILNQENKDVEQVLNELLAGTGYTFKVKGNYLIIVPGNGQPTVKSKKVQGIITDQNGQPVIGANVVEKGKSNMTVTDINGQYSIEIHENGTLSISYLGCLTQEISPRNGNLLDVKLKEDTQKLEELVVVGYGTQKKINLTGSVSTVSSQSIQDIPVSTLSNALSGKIAGVLITQSGGKPGSGSSISVRAQGTWNNADPLYVIDGVVRDKFAFDGLDATEVENLSVLKDGASAAIYGSRAANGVVLVTTKKGKMGKPVISYSGSVGISDATKIPETQNGYDQAIFTNDNMKVENVDTSDSRYYTQDELDFFKENNWNWLDEAWKQPFVARQSMNVSGGNDKVRYFVGGNYFYETGSFNNLKYDKYNFRGNIEANVTKDLIATFNLNMDIRNDDKPYWRYDYDNDTMKDLYKALLFRTSQVPPYINGKPTGSYVEWHPLEIIGGNTGYNRKKYSNYEANMALQYNVPFVPGLSLKMQYNKYNRHSFVKQFNRPYQLYVFKMTGEHNHIITDQLESVKTRDDGDFLYEKYTADNNYQLNAYVTYANTFGKHDVGALLVYEQSEGTVDWFDGQRNYFISSAIDQLFAGSSDTKNSSVTGEGSETGRLSYVGRLNYSYDQKYLLEASFRYDGSVKFSPKNRWGFFPSVSAAWRVSEESFFKNNVEFVDYLKLRGSVGLLGNDAVGGWQWTQSYTLVDGAYFGTLSSGVEANVLPNENITWEKSLTYNGGFDANFLKNKLTLSFDAFYKHTYDILGSRIASLPTTFGASMPSENYAVINAKGFEIELGYADKFAPGFNYYVKGNLGYAVNKLITKDQAENLRAYKSEIGHNTDRTMGYIATDIIRTQKDLDALPAGYTILGETPELGMLNYKDLRGPNSDTPDGIIDDSDQDWIINHTTPPVNYGVSLGTSWKGFALDVFLQGVAGSKTMIDTRGSQARPQETNFAFWTDHYTEDNVNASFPRASRSTSDVKSTFWVRDESFLRLKNVSLSYSFPQNITSKLNIAQLRAFLIGNNICLLQNKLKYYDPENSSIRAYPLMKSYSLGVNISF